ncbi:MAG: hypothetical protein KDK90_21140 [Leptospiraceae bacterium]|nr:hypothetical protein [Leptospiraceae bacterium]
MTIFFHGTGIFLFSFFIHILIWRLNLTQKTPKDIIKIFLGLYMVIFVYILVIKFYQNQVNVEFFINYLYIYIVSFSLFFAYLLTYPAIESDSPSNTILLKLEKHPEGMPKEELLQIFDDNSSILERIKGLERDRKVIQINGKYILTNEGKRFFKIFKYTRMIYTKEPFGG